MSGEAICARFDSLRSLRQSNWEGHWQEVAQVIAPRFSDMLDAGLASTDGAKRNQRVYDSTGVQANELLAAGLHGIATNPATRWFGVRVLDDELMKSDDVREYLSEVQAGMFREMHSPNAGISTHLHEAYLDAGAFGTGVMFIGDEGGRPQFQTRHLKEVHLADGADGEVDTVFRCFQMTARQLWQRSQVPFSPLWTLPDEVAKAVKADKWDQQFEVIHGVFPRMERDAKKKTADNLEIASTYVLREGKKVLHDGGFEEFPYAIFLWSKNPGEVYGRGPGMSALPDVKMLQQMMKVHIRAAQKMIDPPLMTTHDSVLGPVRTMPGGMNYLRPGGDIRPLQTGGRLDLSFEMMQDVRNRIGQAFHSDVVRPFAERTTETATEVMQRVQQQMRLLGPVLGRMEKFLGQIITRVHGIMARAGKLPDPPEELEGVSFSVEFVSPIATAQRTGEVDNVSNWLAMNLQLAQADPAVMDRMKIDGVPEWTAERMRIDPDLVLDDKEAAAKAQARQQQQQLAMAQPMAGAAKDGAQAVATMAQAGNA